MKATTSQADLGAAFASHQAGRLDDAEQGYRRLLRREPRNADALHLLGLLTHQRGRSAEAEDLIAKAIKSRPDPAFVENLAIVQKAAGALGRAIETCRAGLARGASPRLLALLIESLLEAGAYRDALAVLDEIARRDPLSAERTAERAFCLIRLGRHTEARQAAEQALAIDKANVNALAILAEIASNEGRHGDAADLWRRALGIRPDWQAAQVNLGISLARHGDAPAAIEVLQPLAALHDPTLVSQRLNGLAVAYRATDKPDRARRCLESALTVAPGAAELLANLSEMRRNDDTELAIRLADRALAAAPMLADAHINRGLALEETHRLDEALASLRRAVVLMPADMRYLNNLASPLRWLGHFDQAETIHHRLLAIDPSFIEGWYGLGSVQLVRGNLAEGWANYDWRIRDSKVVKQRPFRLPIWGGPSQSHGPLLVWGEQGLGDEIMCGSMLPDLVDRDIKAIVECDARMVDIFSRAIPQLDFVARRIPHDIRLERPDLVAQVPMASLGRWFRSRIEDFQPRAYLSPRPDLVEHWRRRLAELGDGPKIGFAWRSSRLDAVARHFHPPILEWLPVLRQSGATFVSLQYGDTAEDLRAVEAASGIVIHRLPDLDLFNDLEGIIGLSASLDLVVTTGTTAFMLPAAIGRPIWLAMHANDPWRLGTTDRYPWFADTRLYFHRHEEPWSATLGQIAGDLSAFIARHRSR